MCIASAILVTGSVICFHFIFCSYYVFVYLTCVRCLYIFLVHAFNLFFNKLRQIIPEVRSEMRDLLIFIYILKTTGTFTPVHSAGYLILRNEKEKKLTFLNHLLALDNVFSTNSEEQEVNLVWPNLFLIFDWRETIF
jgi:hypothetical protein